MISIRNRCLGAIFFLALSARAQVIFIDVDTLAPTNVVAAAPTFFPRPCPSLQLNVSVVRFVPDGKSTAFKGKLTGTMSFAEIVKALGKEGQVNLLYLGSGNLRWATNELATFRSLERRPAFSLDAAVNQGLTNRQFGMMLRIGAEAATNRQVFLHWDGTFSWSSQLVDLWAGDKYLMFGMRLAKFLKPGMVYTEYDNPDDAEQSGINLRSLFGKKSKEEKAKEEKAKAAAATPNVSFLELDLEEIKLDGKQILKENELAILNFPGRKEKNFQEIIYLLIQPVFEN